MRMVISEQPCSERKVLLYKSSEGNNFYFAYKSYKCTLYSHKNIAGIQKGEMFQEKAHGRVKTLVQENCGDNEYVAS